MIKLYPFVMVALGLMLHGNSGAAQSNQQPSNKVPNGKFKPGQTIYEALKILELKYHVNFIYETSEIKDLRIGTVVIRGDQVDQILESILKPKGLTYRKHGKIYAIVPADGSAVENSAAAAQAQSATEKNPVSLTRKLSGTIVDEAGNALAMVNVVIKGTQLGTISDENGAFHLSIPNGKKTVTFSSLGYETQSPKVTRQTNLDVILKTESKQLGEFVISALGFKYQADKLGMTSSAISGTAIIQSGENNLINALAGKASGLIISPAGADPGSGSAIQIRGINTITGNNQPLVILDGIPISNSMQGALQDGSLQQSRLNDLNPDDIASVQILKGASAAAVWGSRAANGVLVITSKSGSPDKLSISYNSSLSLDRVNAYYPRQQAYGQGVNGVFSSAAPGSWGDKIAERAGGEDEVNTSGAYFRATSGKMYYPVIKKNSKDVFVDDNYKNVFRTGTSLNQTLSISGTDDNSSFYLSLGNLSQKGIYNGNSSYKRYSFKLNTERKFGEILRFVTRTTFSKTSSDRQGRNYEFSGPPASLLNNPADFDQSDYIGNYYGSPAASPVTGRQRSYLNPIGANANPLAGNPNWALHEQQYTSDVTRFINSFELVVKPFSFFDITARAGYDFSMDDRLNYYPINDLNNSGKGQFFTKSYKEAEWSADVIGRVSRQIGEQFSFTYLAGFNVNDRTLDFAGMTVSSFITGNLPINPANATSNNRLAANQKTKIRNARTYNTLNITGFNALFFNASLAAEASSTFGGQANSLFYYPSADLAWQFSRLGLFKESGILNFGKLRASYGVVGIQPQPYMSATLFNPAIFNQAFLGFGDYVDGSLYGNGAYMSAYNRGTRFLKPERKTEYELGADVRLFGSKVRAAVNFYHNTVRDILMNVNTPVTTGAGTVYANLGSLKNNGFEADLSFDILHTPDFSWSLTGNFSRIRNTVTSTSSASVLLNSYNIVRTVAIVGRPLGVFYSGTYLRNPEGNVVLDKNQFPVTGLSYGEVGNPNPDFTAALSSGITYKKLSLQLLFETSQGGDILEGTKGAMYSMGTHADVGKEVTLQADTKNYAGKTFPAGTTVRGNLHDFGGGPVLLDQAYYTSIGGGYSESKQHLVSDGSWTRLRLASLSYRLDSERFRKWSRLKEVDLTLAGRNLFLWTKINGIDPETNALGILSARNQDYFNPPATRSFIFSIRVTY